MVLIAIVQVKPEITRLIRFAEKFGRAPAVEQMNVIGNALWLREPRARGHHYPQNYRRRAQV